MNRLLATNAVLGLASSAFGVLALARPDALDPTHSPSGFYARMYASRSIPLGVAVAATSAGVGGPPSPAVLAAAAAAQLGDAAIGAANRNPGMTLFPMAGALVHAATAWTVANRPPITTA